MALLLKNQRFYEVFGRYSATTKAIKNRFIEKHYEQGVRHNDEYFKSIYQLELSDMKTFNEL